MINLAKEHDYCVLTQFCKKCGQARIEIARHDCVGGGNVTGITHLLAMQKFQGILRGLK